MVESVLDAFGLFLSSNCKLVINFVFDNRPTHLKRESLYRPGGSESQMLRRLSTDLPTVAEIQQIVDDSQ